MKNSLTLLVILLLTVMSCSKQLEITPEKAVVFVQTQTGTPIGGMVNTTITATGGTAILPSVGVKVIVPAGAMPTGSQLSIQQVSNILNSNEKAIRISGDWIKPISIEYQLTNSESGNYNVFVSIPMGVWVGAKKAKVSGNTMSVRLGPNSGPDIKGGRVAAKTYDLAFAKFFTIKPDRVALDLGKTQQFVAYAKEGFVPRKHVNGSLITSESELNSYLKKLDEIDASVASDDDLVPLAPPKNATADDELVPIAVYAKEYPFSNTKEGYTRLWKINQGVGSVNSNGLYTAPSDEASKGKTAEVWFLSQNNKNTAQNLVVGANIRINDGLQRYEGTVKVTNVLVSKESNNVTRTRTIVLSAKITLINSTGVPWAYKHEANPKSTIKTTVDDYLEITSDGEVKIQFTGDRSKTTDGGLWYLDFEKDYKTYKMDGSIDGLCATSVYCKRCSPQNSTENDRFASSDFATGYNFKQTPVQTVTNLDVITGKLVTNTKVSNSDLTITSEWNFKLVK